MLSRTDTPPTASATPLRKPIPVSSVAASAARQGQASQKPCVLWVSV